MTWGAQPHKGYVFATDMNSGVWVGKLTRQGPGAVSGIAEVARRDLVDGCSRRALAGLLACQPAAVSPITTAPAPSAALARIVADLSAVRARPPCFRMSPSPRSSVRPIRRVRSLRGWIGCRAPDLSHEDELTLEILRHEANRRVRDVDVYWFLVPGGHGDLAAPDGTGRARGTTAGDRFGAHGIPVTASAHRGGGRRHPGQDHRAGPSPIVVPLEQIDLNLPYIRSFADSGATNPLALSARQLALVPESARSGFAAAAARTIDSAIAPRALALAGTVEELRSIAPPRVGLWQIPGEPMPIASWSSRRRRST